MRRAKSPRGAGRSARRGLALLLVFAYASVAARAAAADAQGASREATRAKPSSFPLLRLIEEAATRQTQWHHRVGRAGGSGDGSSSSESSSGKSNSGGVALVAGAPVAGAAAPPPLHAAAAADPAPSHPPLFPLRPSDFAVFFLAALTLFTAAGGGIGGGTLFVPLFTVVGGFAPTNAVALSTVTVFGGALANFLLNVRRPYARALRALPRNALAAVRRPPPLVDWVLILMMEPMTLVGALAGGYAHRLLPSWILLTLLAALLVYLTRQLALKAASTYAAETREQQRERAAAWANRAAGEAGGGGGDGLTAPLLGGDGKDGEDDGYGEADGGEIDQGGDEEAARTRARAGGGKGGKRSRRRPPPLIIVAAGPDSSTPALSDDVGGGGGGGGGGADQDPSAAAGSSSSSAAALARAAPHQTRQEQEQNGGGSGGGGDEDDDPLERLLATPARVPVAKVLAITALTAWMLCADVVKTRLPCGSAPYALASLSVVPLALAVTLAQRDRALRRAEAAAEAHAALDAAQRQVSLMSRLPGLARQSAGADAGPSNLPLPAVAQWSPEAVRAALASHVRWTRRNSVLYPLLASLAGVAASMFGIGGGVVKGPLMLSLGVCPEVAAATSSTMILFTSAGASLFYFNAGFVQRDYAGALLLVAFACTGAGQVASQRLVRALGRRSVIVMAMAAMMLAAAAVAVLQGAFAMRAAVRAGALWQWGSICSRGDD